MMTYASLIGRARDTEFYVGGLQELAKHLPQDDDALDAALREAIEEREAMGFSFILMAALGDGKAVDGRILERGAGMLIGPTMLVAAAMHCEGDVASALMAAINGGTLAWGVEAVALVMTAWWLCEGGVAVPEELIRRARVVARESKSDFELGMLAEFGEIAGIPDLAPTRPGVLGARQRRRQLEFQEWIDETDCDVMAFVPTKRPRGISGYTVRRAVARVGRNEPCHCGSGKKYKRCCMEADQERLRHSSDIEGVTTDEIRRNPEAYLTKDRLWDMNPPELVGIDAAQVSEDLHGALILRLCEFRLYEAAARVFETIGWKRELDRLFAETVERAAAAGQKEVVRRLIELRGEQEDVKVLSLRARIMGPQMSPDQMLALLETKARETLDEEQGPGNIAYALLASCYPALGILVARGALPMLNDMTSFFLLQELLTARDKLGLTPLDPAEELMDVLEELNDEESEEESSAEEVEARRELELKAAESRTLREELRRRDAALAEMEDKLRQAEESARPKAQEKSAGEDKGAYDPRLVEDLRRRLAARKEEVKQKHAERNALRDELARAREEVEALRRMNGHEGGGHGKQQEADGEADQELLGRDDEIGTQPVRVLRFERQFEDDLRVMPVKVARMAMRLTGRLAAGESAAWRGAKHLSGREWISSQRVGIGHRLLFRAEDETLTVMRLVTREDLRRTVRSMAPR